jgi:hypothetical protein
MAVSLLTDASAIVVEVLQKDYYEDALVIHDRAKRIMQRDMPPEIDEMFRDALRALGSACATASPEQFDLQISVAKRHFSNAKRICYKRATSYLKDRLGTDLLALEQEGRRFRSRLRKQFGVINAAHEAVLEAEAAGQVGIDAQFNGVWNQYDQFKEALEEQVQNMHELRRAPLSPRHRF